MRSFNPIRKAGTVRRRQRGSMLLELMIAIVVLAVGMGGLIPLLVSSMYTNAKAGNDTTSTMLAEHVIEQISAQPANVTGSTAVVWITDCAGTTWTVNTLGSVLGAGSGANGGNGANLTSSGIIDWTQSYASVPTDYKMKYVACGAGGRQTVYDVRWNVLTMTNYARMIFVSAHPVGSFSAGGMRYIVPINLRTIGGM